VEDLALERVVAHDEVVVLDYGGQYSQLIARRVRECGVFSELLPHHVGVRRSARRKPKGLILSAARVGLRDGAPAPGSRSCSSSGSPCWASATACRRIVLTLGGKVEGAEVGEFGRSRLTVVGAGPAARRHAGRPVLLDVAPRHGLRPAAGFTALASSSASPVAALESVERGIYGIQYHPRWSTPRSARTCSGRSSATCARAT
jgi:GMP synthase (glutamine-hydrolysing)